jgi:hypothetical protein
MWMRELEVGLGKNGGPRDEFRMYYESNGNPWATRIANRKPEDEKGVNP